MNKIKYFLALAVASLVLGAGPAMAAPLNGDFMNSLDLSATHNSPPYSTVARSNAPLNLNLAPSPDIAAHFLMADYSGNTLNINGTAFSYVDESGAPFVINEVFSLTALIDSSGGFDSGSFSIGTLLTGDLLDFGYSAWSGGALDDSSLEFMFRVTGGDVADAFGGNDALGGMLITQLNFDGDWTANWTGDFGVVDVQTIAAPEPGILLLGGLGLTLLVAARRRKI